MFLSRPALRLLNWGLAAGAICFVLGLVMSDPDPMLWVVAALLVGLFVFLGFVGDAEIETAEAADARRAQAFARAPVETTAEEIDEAAQGLARWCKGLSIAAFVAALLMMVDACPGSARETVEVFLSGALWLGVCAAAWFVRDRASTAAALLLLVVPIADLVAVGFAVEQGRLAFRDLFPELAMPLVLTCVAVRCCVLTFRYRRLLNT